MINKPLLLLCFNILLNTEADPDLERVSRKETWLSWTRGNKEFMTLAQEFWI